MTKLSIFTLLSIVYLLSLYLPCNALIALEAAANAKDFDETKLWETIWYERAWFEIAFTIDDACGRYEFYGDSEGLSFYQGAWYEPGIGGEISSIHYTVERSSAGVYKVTNADVEGAAFYILAYDEKNYDWFVLGDNFTLGGYISVLTKTDEENPVAIAKGQELATKFGFPVAHSNIVHGNVCKYEPLFAEMDTVRQAAANPTTEGGA